MLQDTNLDLLTLVEAASTTPDSSAEALDQDLNGGRPHRELLARYHWLGGRVADMQASWSCIVNPSKTLC